jgi:flavin reductase (DIM6/NTAB) family NADH-FMN oxidoreductase RutF
VDGWRGAWTILAPRSFCKDCQFKFAAAVKPRSTALPTSSVFGALAAIDCEVEDMVERHSHAIVIGRVLDLQLSSRTAALAYWQGQYVAIDRDEDAVKLAEVSVPGPRIAR